MNMLVVLLKQKVDDDIYDQLSIQQFDDEVDDDILEVEVDELFVFENCYYDDVLIMLLYELDDNEKLIIEVIEVPLNFEKYVLIDELEITE